MKCTWCCSQGGSSTGSSRSSISWRTSLFHSGLGSVMSGQGSAAPASTTTAAAAAAGAPLFQDAQTSWPSQSAAAADTNAFMADMPADLPLDALDELEFLHDSPLGSDFGSGGADAAAAGGSGLLSPSLPHFSWPPNPELAPQPAPSSAPFVPTCLARRMAVALRESVWSCFRSLSDAADQQDRD